MHSRLKKEKEDISQDTLRTPITRKSQDMLRTPKPSIDENTTETRDFIMTIKRNGLETNQTILQPKVTVEVMGLLYKS